MTKINTHNAYKHQSKTADFTPTNQPTDLNNILQQIQSSPGSLNHDGILHLQRTIGNSAVRRLLSRLNETQTTKLSNKPHIQAVQSTSKSIQFKLSGNASFLESIEGNKKTKLMSKWQSILSNLKKYEKLEQKYALGDKNPKKLQILRQLLELTRNWMNENKDNVNQFHSGESDKKLPEKIETDAQKMSALITLWGRLAEEYRIIKNEEFNSDYTSNRDHETEDFDSAGDVSSIRKITYGQTETEKEEQGFFQDETDYYDGEENAGYKTGIPKHNPNYGARAVAMGRIDQLITERLGKVAVDKGIDIQPMLVKTKFAISTNSKSGEKKQGIFLDKAKGEEMRGSFINEGNAAIPQSELDTSNDAGSKDRLSLDDPILMRSLNKLQILDALCGQVDRHTGNYFVLTDENGDVIGVQGIDNDMAFGQDITDPNDPEIRKRTEGKAWRGLPLIIDKEMKDAIDQISEADVKTALEGLLTRNEIESTVRRFDKTKEFFNNLPVDNLISPKKWKDQKQSLFAGQKGKDSYLGEAKGESAKKLIGPYLSVHSSELEKFLRESLTEDQKNNSKIKYSIGEIITGIQNNVLPNLVSNLGVAFNEAKTIGEKIAVSCLNMLNKDELETDTRRETTDKIIDLINRLLLNYQEKQ